jgi:hypothetical protein
VWWRPEVRVGYRQTMAGEMGDTTARFTGGNPFTLAALDDKQGAATLGFALKAGTPMSYLALEGGVEAAKKQKRYNLRSPAGRCSKPLRGGRFDARRSPFHPGSERFRASVKDLETFFISLISKEIPGLARRSVTPPENLKAQFPNLYLRTRNNRLPYHQQADARRGAGRGRPMTTTKTALRTALIAGVGASFMTMAGAANAQTAPSDAEARIAALEAQLSSRPCPARSPI